jgi:hypothetical protein
MNASASPDAPFVSAGEIAALGLLHEIGHVLIARYEERQAPGPSAGRSAICESTLGRRRRRLLDRFGQEFPGRCRSPSRRPTGSRSCS